MKKIKKKIRQDVIDAERHLKPMMNCGKYQKHYLNQMQSYFLHQSDEDKQIACIRN
jgi:hypothetical protein